MASESSSSRASRPAFRATSIAASRPSSMSERRSSASVRASRRLVELSGRTEPSVMPPRVGDGSGHYRMMVQVERHARDPRNTVQRGAIRGPRRETGGDRQHRAGRCSRSVRRLTRLPRRVGGAGRGAVSLTRSRNARQIQEDLIAVLRPDRDAGNGDGSAGQSWSSPMGSVGSTSSAHAGHGFLAIEAFGAAPTRSQGRWPRGHVRRLATGAKYNLFPDAGPGGHERTISAGRLDR